MKKIVLLFIFISPALFCQNPFNSNFRGLSVVNDSIAWIGGIKGNVGRTTNGGRDWSMKQVSGLEKVDFRSIYAFDSNKAVIANAGTPANILITNDGGNSWKTVYTNTDTSAFFDGMDFWNDKEGIIYGDAINGRMLLLKTIDGGLHWEELPMASRPVLRDNEASFAASGTGIRCIGKNKLMITTGGATARLLISNNKGMTWDSIGTPMLSGQSGRGIFSVAYINEKTFVIVGGDYRIDTLKKDHVFYTTNGGKTWIAPGSPTGGYRECVEYLSDKTLIAIGPSGTDISKDGGKTWKPFSTERGFHVIRKARKGKLVLEAGNGKVTIVRMKE